MALSVVNRIIAFERGFDRAQATEVVDLPWGYFLLQADFPHSYHHNKIVVTAAASADEVLTASQDLMGGAGLKHRYVAFNDDSLGQALAPELIAGGYELETNVVMVYSGPEPELPAHDVRFVSLDELRPALVRDWRVELPEASDEEIGQLADRTPLYSLGADVTLLAVFDGEKVAARAELYISETEGIAQLENLFTHPDYRGKRYADSVVGAALKRGREAGCDLRFLTADLDDWPHQWYTRKGYVEVSRSHHFRRFP